MKTSTIIEYAILVAIFGGVVAAVTGCTVAPKSPAPPPETVYEGWTWPKYLQTCADDAPDVPVPHTTMQSGAAHYIENSRDYAAREKSVADDCRDTLAAALFSYMQPAVK